MKIVFYIGVAGLVLFELANVYFIMPMPGASGCAASTLPTCSTAGDGLFD